MRFARTLFALAALVVAAGVPAAAPAADAAPHGGVFFPETFTLANGLQVVVVTNRTMPVVSHDLFYKVGAADEAWGHSGAAHFLEHLMFLGTPDTPEGEFDRIVTQHGGEHNAFTNWDYTGYYQNVSVENLALMMRLEADRMANLQVDPNRALIERSVILEERRQRTDNDPGARLGEQMFAALFQNHPYGRPIIGWEQEMAQLTLDDEMAFYRTWYAPNNAILVVSGDIDAATLRPLAEATYGRIPARPVPERLRPVEPPTAAARSVVLADPDVQQPSWRRYYLAPSYRTAEGDEAYALQVLDEILGSGTTSRLYRSLVVDQQIATSAGSFYSASAWDDNVFGIGVSPRPGVGMDQVETAVEAEIGRLLGGITDDELDAAKQRLVIQADYAMDSLQGPASTLGGALATGQTVEDVEAWPTRIAAVTADEVMAAARSVLDETRSVTGHLLPAEQNTAQLSQ